MLVPPLRILIVLVAAMAFGVALAAPAGAQVVTPQPIPLTAGWQYQADPDGVGDGAGWRSGDLSEAWPDVEIPHVFNPTPVDAEFLGTVGWYRLRIPTPATPAGFTWALRFEGVRRKATVYLNGRRVGFNTNPYEPFDVAASNLRPPGQMNTLVVRVSNMRTTALREGWWNWGGITRPVSLQPVGQVVLGRRRRAQRHRLPGHRDVHRGRPHGRHAGQPHGRSA